MVDMEGLANVGMACEDMGSIGSAEWSRQVMWDCTARAKIREVRYPVPQLHSYKGNPRQGRLAGQAEAV
jgi:hypothetical protein